MDILTKQILREKYREISKKKSEIYFLQKEINHLIEIENSKKKNQSFFRAAKELLEVDG